MVLLMGLVFIENRMLDHTSYSLYKIRNLITWRDNNLILTFFFSFFFFRGEDDYVPGNIIEIELHNFMTFSHLKCKPGPRLNLVIGPNGSGKSSLVCAIALGLVGEPQVSYCLIT